MIRALTVSPSSARWNFAVHERHVGPVGWPSTQGTRLAWAAGAKTSAARAATNMGSVEKRIASQIGRRETRAKFAHVFLAIRPGLATRRRLARWYRAPS